MPFAKALPPGTFSFACQKRTRKAPATFEAREAAGCGSLRLLRALRGTRILQAAAPTAPPCFGRWPRSSPLQTRGCSPLVTPKLLGSIQKIQVASLKDFLCSADWKPLSRCATVPSKREPLAKPESVMVCPETLPLCQGLSLWESWQARQGLTERTSQLPGAHSKSFVLSPETVQFLIFPPLKVKNPAEKRFRWFKNRFGCAILGVKVPVWTGNRRA